MRPDLGAEAVFERCDDAAAVGVVLGVRARHDQDVERESQCVAAHLNVALLHHVEHGDLDAFGKVGQLVDGDDAAVRTGNESEVNGLRIAEAAALGHLHRVDVADEIGHGRVGCRELLAVAPAAMTPFDRELVEKCGCASNRRRRDRLVRMLAEFRALDDRRPLVEQADQCAQNARFALAAFAEHDHVVARDQRTLELRYDRRLEPDDSRPRVVALAKRGEQVVADLVTHTALHMAAGTQLADGSW